jgi:hypothetical protein
MGTLGVRAGLGMAEFVVSGKVGVCDEGMAALQWAWRIDASWAVGWELMGSVIVAVCGCPGVSRIETNVVAVRCYCEIVFR